MAWLSPSYPVGAFSYSSGIEWAVEAGDIKDADSLQALARRRDRGGRRLLRRGVLRSCPSVIGRHRRRGAADGRRACRGLRALEGAPSGDDGAGRGLHRGDARGLALRRARPARRGLDWASGLSGRGRRRGGGPRHRARAALHAFLHAVTANLISAGVRLIPLGQSDGQRVLAALEPVVEATAQRALATSLDDVGSAALRADLASMLHETQYTRLFRS